MFVFCLFVFKKGTSYLNLLIFKNIWYLQISSAGIIKSAFITSADTLFFSFFFLWKNPLSLELCGDFPARASCFNILMRFISGSFFAFEPFQCGFASVLRIISLLQGLLGVQLQL